MLEEFSNTNGTERVKQVVDLIMRCCNVDASAFRHIEIFAY